MQNEELFEEIDTTQSITQEYFGLSFTKFFVFVFIILSLGIYIGTILYGTNSIEIFLGLEEYETYLQTEVTSLKNENAQLQREYFELKEISAQ